MSMKNERGFSVVQIIVIAGVGLTVALGLMGGVMQQVQQVQMLALKVNMRDVRFDVEITLTDTQNCMASIQGLTFDDARVDDPTYVVNLAGPVRQVMPAPRVLLEVGQAPLGLEGRLSVEALQLANFVRIAPNSYEADLVANTRIHPAGFASQRHVMGRIAIITDVASLPPNKLPTLCSASSITAPPSLGACNVVEASAPDTNPVQALCAPGERLVGGGGECLMPDGNPWLLYATNPNETKGYLIVNHPIRVGTEIGWTTDCYNHLVTDGARARAYAHCCPQ